MDPVPLPPRADRRGKVGESKGFVGKKDGQTCARPGARGVIRPLRICPLPPGGWSAAERSDRTRIGGWSEVGPSLSRRSRFHGSHDAR
jgi:hypothetical protein